MITVTVRENHSNTFVKELKVSGHSNTAPKGYDIVCAAVSTLCFTALRGMTNVLHHNVNADVEDGKFDLTIFNPNTMTETLMRSIVAGLENVASGARDIVEIKYEK